MPKQMTLRLLGRQNEVVATPQVPFERVGEISVIQYGDRWFSFAGFGGRFYCDPTFRECSQPLVIEVPKCSSHN